MSLTLKKTIVNVGYGIETLGNITIVVASIVGVVLTTVALIAYAQKNNNSQHGTTNNLFWINIPNNPTRHRSHHCTYSELMLIAASFCFSLIGVGIAIAVPMYWIGITIVALWASGLLLSALGRGLIHMGLNWEDKIEPVSQTIPLPEATEIGQAEEVPDDVDIVDESVVPGSWVQYHTPFIAQYVGY